MAPEKDVIDEDQNVQDTEGHDQTLDAFLSGEEDQDGVNVEVHDEEEESPRAPAIDDELQQKLQEALALNEQLGQEKQALQEQIDTQKRDSANADAREKLHQMAINHLGMEEEEAKAFVESVKALGGGHTKPDDFDGLVTQKVTQLQEQRSHEDRVAEFRTRVSKEVPEFAVLLADKKFIDFANQTQDGANTIMQSLKIINTRLGADDVSHIKRYADMYKEQKTGVNPKPTPTGKKVPDLNSQKDDDLEAFFSI